MKSNQIGKAFVLPNSFSPRELKSSLPTHAEATILEANPENQVLVALLVVPVFLKHFQRELCSSACISFNASLRMSELCATLGSIA